MFDRLNGPQAQSQTRRIVHLTRPTDKRVGKRGDALRARSEASMIARLRVARPSAAPVPKSDAELIAADRGRQGPAHPARHQRLARVRAERRAHGARDVTAWAGRALSKAGATSTPCVAPESRRSSHGRTSL